MSEAAKIKKKGGEKTVLADVSVIKLFFAFRR
jgi:hypothetical protein